MQRTSPPDRRPTRTPPPKSPPPRTRKAPGWLTQNYVLESSEMASLGLVSSTRTRPQASRSGGDGGGGAGHVRDGVEGQVGGGVATNDDEDGDQIRADPLEPPDLNVIADVDGRGQSGWRSCFVTESSPGG